MDVVIDTSILMAVLTGEAQKSELIKLTEGMDLLAPPSVHWEIGNALAAMLKRNRIDEDQISVVLEAYSRIPIRFIEVTLVAALRVAAEYGLYAYDAYVIACALERHCSLISLDKGLVKAALRAKVDVLEVGA